MARPVKTGGHEGRRQPALGARRPLAERKVPVGADGEPVVSRRPGQQPIRVFEDHPREILTRHDFGSAGIHYTLNPYRGCTIGCVYCSARPRHEFLGEVGPSGFQSWSAGADFDSRIVERPDAPMLLDETLAKKRMHGRVIQMSGGTDPYQPLEAALGITRACLEVCLRHGNPVAIQTKSDLILRDRDLLVALARGPGVHVAVSMASFDPARAAALEPGAISPAARIELIRKLAELGIPVGISIAPAILGLTDTDIVRILTSAKDAGATTAFYLRLRLPGLIEPALVRRVKTTLPDRARKVMDGLAGYGATASGRRLAPSADDPMEQIFCFTADRLGLAFERRSPWPATVTDLEARGRELAAKHDAEAEHDSLELVLTAPPPHVGAAAVSVAAAVDREEKPSVAVAQLSLFSV